MSKRTRTVWQHRGKPVAAFRSLPWAVDKRPASAHVRLVLQGLQRHAFSLFLNSTFRLWMAHWLGHHARERQGDQLFNFAYLSWSEQFRTAMAVLGLTSGKSTLCEKPAWAIPEGMSFLEDCGAHVEEHRPPAVHLGKGARR